MKEFITSQLTTATTLAGIAREILIDTRNAATSKVSDLRAQVDELWQNADELLPRKQASELMRRVERAVESMRQRDQIGFPKEQKA